MINLLDTTNLSQSWGHGSGPFAVTSLQYLITTWKVTLCYELCVRTFIRSTSGQIWTKSPTAKELEGSTPPPPKLGIKLAPVTDATAGAGGDATLGPIGEPMLAAAPPTLVSTAGLKVQLKAKESIFTTESKEKGKSYRFPDE